MSALLLATLGAPVAFAQASSAPATPAKCGKVRIKDLVAQPGPAILFLGARNGTQRDIAKARRLVKKLALAGPVTVAVEPVLARRQEVLERLDLGRLPFERLEQALSWGDDFAYDYTTYAPLFGLHDVPSVSFLAVGQPVELTPQGASVIVPPGYATLLADTTGDGPVPAALENRFSETVAWHDHRVAKAAVEGWHGRGWLIVLVDRTWVEGGLGMPWQAERLTDAPVSSALLAKAGGRCYPGDRLLR